MFGHISCPACILGSAHSCVASSRTAAGSRMVNPRGSTSRAFKLDGWVDSVTVIRVSPGISRHMAAGAVALAGILTPPGFTAAGDGPAVARGPPAALPGPAAPVPAAPVPATVLPQAPSPIMRLAAMPPSAACLAAPFGVPSTIIATPSAPRAYGRRPAAWPRTAHTGRARGAGPAARAGPAVFGAGTGPGTPGPPRWLLVRAGPAAPGLPALTWTGCGTIWFPPARRGSRRAPVVVIMTSGA